ncbi:Interleukin-13 receptor subunit alpha-1, partial [Galemys pyrenaicus]
PRASRRGLPAAGGRGGVGRGGPSRLRRPRPPGRRSREVGAGAPEAETAEAPARPGSEARGCMERPARVCALWALLFCAGGGAEPTGECDPWGSPGRRSRGRRGRRGGPARAPPNRGPRRGRTPGTVLTLPRARRFPSHFEVGDPGAAGLPGVPGGDGDQGLLAAALPLRRREEPRSLGQGRTEARPRRRRAAGRDPDCRLSAAEGMWARERGGTAAGVEAGRERTGSPCLRRHGAGEAESQPPVTNLSVSVENLCTVVWTWNPPEGASPNCSLWYFSHFSNKQDKKIAPETRRLKEVALNERICLHVGTQCSTSESEKPSILKEKCTPPPEGDPESAVTELQCVWHNLSYMKCTWLPGKNTSPDTNYTLSYWHRSLGNILQCVDIFREDQRIGCSFALAKVSDFSLEQHSVQIMVRDDAGKIRPSYSIVPLTSHVKPGPPHIKKLFFHNGDLYVQWKNPPKFSSRCLFYEVEVNNSQTDTPGIFSTEETKCQDSEFEGDNEETVCFMIPGVTSNTLNTVRVRVKTNKLCYEDDLFWSNWSEAKSIGTKTNSTLYIAMLLTIPVIVAGAIIVLLLYLKRLKIIIFPPIPDPGKIFKGMFGDQNDDTLHWKKYDIYEKQTKEETDSVVLIENLKRASQ